MGVARLVASTETKAILTTMGGAERGEGGEKKGERVGEREG